jgi:hypothetical protein
MDAASDDLSEWICRYGSLYGPQLVLIATLSAITVYRREMSCNHCYAPEKIETTTDSSDWQHDEWNEAAAEVLLDGGSLYCSGASLQPIVLRVCAFLRETEHCLSLQTAHAPDNYSTVATEDLLEMAGMFLSGEPLASALLGVSKSSVATPQSSACPSSLEIPESQLFAAALPPDLLLHVCTFLAPVDVVTLACVDTTCRAVTGQAALWKAAWERDYGWSIHHTAPGRAAWERSTAATTATDANLSTYDQYFYFTFGLAFCDYITAGQNRVDSCLVSLGGAIYDMTSFVLQHPGSPETVLVNAGKDATPMFRSVRHSTSALRKASSLCVVVTPHSGVGVRPTQHTRLLAPGGRTTTTTAPPPPRVPAHIMDTQVTTRVSTGNIDRIRTAFAHQRLQARRAASQSRHARTPRLTDLNIYYDPFCASWKAWYTDEHMQTIYVDDLVL